LEEGRVGINDDLQEKQGAKVHRCKAQKKASQTEDEVGAQGAWLVDLDVAIESSVPYLVEFFSQDCLGAWLRLR